MNYAQTLAVQSIARTIRPLYVCRKLQNASELIAWAKSQGFTKVLAPDELHVTVVFSRSPVNWQALSPKTNTLVVEGGIRIVSPLGDKGAVVLKFDSPVLQSRWFNWRTVGASWDYPGYQPHVSLTYKNGGVDLSQMRPYQGPLIFGPERYQPIEEDYAADVVEKWEHIDLLGLFERVLKNSRDWVRKTNPYRDKEGMFTTRERAAPGFVTDFGRQFPSENEKREALKIRDTAHLQKALRGMIGHIDAFTENLRRLMNEELNSRVKKFDQVLKANPL